MNFKGVIFDMDGTILDSISVWDKIDVDFLSARGVEVPEDYARTISTMTGEECAKYTIKRFSLTDSVEGLMKEWDERALFEYSNNLRLKKGAKEYIKRLKENGIKIALATSSSKTLYTAAMKNTEVYEYFDVFISTDETGISKKDPHVYIYAAEKLGLNIQDCVIFEDVPTAVKSAKTTGARVVCVWDKRWDMFKEEIKEAADKYIYSFDEMD
ncbi:MAG: HAD family phosphatase [Clostridia bacterium]|nr:HAD family phosphatase [Clostridia bacterium]